MKSRKIDPKKKNPKLRLNLKLLKEKNHNSFPPEEIAE